MFWPCLELPGESLLSLWSAGEKVKGEREGRIRTKLCSNFRRLAKEI